MTQIKLNPAGFILNNDGKIEEITYCDYLREFGADETTSPHGVAPRMHVREKEGIVYQNLETKELISEDDYDNLDEEEQDNYNYYGETTVAWEIWSWGVNGNNPRFTGISFETEDEADNDILEHFEYYIQEKNWNAPRWFESKDELIKDVAEGQDKPVQVVSRFFRMQKFI